MAGEDDQKAPEKETPPAVEKHSGGGVWSAITSPFRSGLNMVGTLGKSVFGSLLDIRGLVMSALGLGLTMKFAPEVPKWIALNIFGRKYSDVLGEDLAKNGDGAVFKHVLIGGVVLNAATAAVKGLAGELIGSAQGDGEESSTLGKVASFAGGALAIAGIAAVTMGAVHRNGIGYAGNADSGTPKNPTPVPNKAENTKVNRV